MKTIYLIHLVNNNIASFESFGNFENEIPLDVIDKAKLSFKKLLIDYDVPEIELDQILDYGLFECCCNYSVCKIQLIVQNVKSYN